MGRSLGMSGALLVLAGLAVSVGCGRTSEHPPEPTDSVAGGGGTTSNGGGPGGKNSVTTIDEGGTSGVAGAEVGGPPISLDTTDCASRPVSACENLPARFFYQSFDDVPGFEQCSSFIPFDGCRKIFFGFDAEGCATQVAPGLGGWEQNALEDMRKCLTDAFATAKFPCFASSTFGFYESCLIR